MKRLIVQADDLGYSDSINEGIFEAYESGALTTASVMINILNKEKAEKIKDKILSLKNKTMLVKPKIKLGVHLNLTFGHALSPQWPRRTLERPNRGIREKQWQEKLWMEYFSSLDASLVEDELKRQMEKALSFFPDLIDHLDTHHFCASYEPVKSIYEKLARDYQLAARPAASLADGINLPIFKIDKNHLKHLRSLGIKCAKDYLWKYYSQNPHPVDCLINDLKKIKGLAAELMFHPAKGLQAESWRKKDLKIVTDPALISYLKKNFELIVYNNL